jgi:hypothetical protein
MTRPLLFVVDRAGRGRQGPGEEIVQPDFGHVKSGPVAAPTPRAGRHSIGAGVFLEAGNRVAALVEQSGDDFAAGVSMSLPAAFALGANALSFTCDAVSEKTGRVGSASEGAIAGAPEVSGLFI